VATAMPGVDKGNPRIAAVVDARKDPLLGARESLDPLVGRKSKKRGDGAGGGD